MNIRRMSVDYPMIEEPKEITGEKISIKSVIGGRRTNEDTHIAYSLGDEVKIFGVFDGHGGGDVADICLKIPSLFYKVLLEEKTRDLIKRGDMKGVIEDFFLHVDRLIYKMEWSGGSTVILVLKWGTTLYFVNIGDSRAILVDGDTRKILHSTVDHKPEREIERVRKAGGRVYGIPPRIDGVISVSRALGDNGFKRGSDGEYRGYESKISPKPDITTYTLEGGEKLILACDGVWDGMKNEEVALYDTAESIISNAFTSSGYCGDNMTVIVYDF